ARKPEHVRRLDAELARSLSNRSNLRVRGGKLASKAPKPRFQRLHLRSRPVHGLLHTSPRRFPIHRGLRGETERANRRRAEAGQRTPDLIPRLPIVLGRLDHLPHRGVGLLGRVLSPLSGPLDSLSRLRHSRLEAVNLSPEPYDDASVSQRAPPIPARRPNHYSINT